MEVRRNKLALLGAWSLAALVSLLSLLAWGRDFQWHFTPFSAYTIFPLLGLIAFSLMWAHYVVGAVRDIASIKPKVLQKYFSYTGYAVLALICLHPGLLIYQLFVDGAGLPPGSYESYVAPGLGWVTILGSASLLVFLAFELHRWFDKKPWWHYVVDAGDFAMLAIAYHGLRLGTDLQNGWFHIVWIFYALTLLAIIGRKYFLRITKPKTKPVN